MKNKLRSVNTRFWDDTFVSELNPSEKLLFLYLLTNPLTNLLGVYEISEKRISFDTGLNLDIIRKGFKRFETVGKAFYIDNYIILPNFLKNQNLNANMKRGVITIFNDLPNTLRDKLIGNGSETISKGSKTISESLKLFETILNGLVKYEIEKEKEIEREKEIEKEKTPDYHSILKEVIKEDYTRGLNPDLEKVILKWLQYKSERGQSYKKTGMSQLIKSLIDMSRGDTNTATAIVEKSIGNNWSGLFPLDDDTTVPDHWPEKTVRTIFVKFFKREPSEFVLNIFTQYEKHKKTLSGKGIPLIEPFIEELKTISGGDLATAVNILKQSIRNGHIKIYDLKSTPSSSIRSGETESLLEVVSKRKEAQK